MTPPCTKLVVTAPAKVNLTLRILGKRTDGYHELDSVMQKVSLADTVILHRLEVPGIQLSCPDSDLPEDNSNLVWKAAETFLDASGLGNKCGVSIILEKKIPIAAGLGGGSSDAGAVLTGLKRLLQSEIPETTLLGLAKSLGADVPFFVVPGSAMRATGIGEKMEKYKKLEDCSILLVNPGFSVSTAWVYENFTLTRAVKDSNLSNSRKNESLSKLCCSLFNDLETVTIKRYPEIQSIKNLMIDNGATDALMSGSGPTVFGIFPDGDGRSVYLRKCVEKLTEKYGSGVFVTRPF
ncbi:MAG TPA: 4-(cytidine 5'-diphospho)-2-C-methyl-D-erythritol kinase [Desulfobacterales bacterium]|nr:4-(cytidine 5'-diphospho)-2-C-methyl-D-erythritol kinase [Desulfobacterales bacterium]